MSEKKYKIELLLTDDQLDLLDWLSRQDDCGPKDEGWQSTQMADLGEQFVEQIKKVKEDAT